MFESPYVENAWRAGVLMVFAVLVLSGCAVKGSMEQYCETLASHRESYLQAMGAATDPSSAADVLGGVSAIGDLKSMWREMAEVAPEEIRSDTESVRDAWSKVEDSAARGDWGAALFAGLLNAGAMERVDAYVRQHCDVASPTPSVQEEQPPTATATESPSDDTALAIVLPENATSLGPLFVDRAYASTEPEARGIFSTGPTTFLSMSGPFDVSADNWFSDKEIEFEGYSVGGSEIKPFVVGVIVVRQPAVNLDPEYFETFVVKVDSAGDLVASNSIARSDVAPSPTVVAGTVDSSAVVYGVYEENSDSSYADPLTYAFSADSGELLWKEPGLILAATRRMVVVAGSEGEYCDAQGVDNASGTVYFSLTPEQYGTDCLDIEAEWRIGNAVLTDTAVGERYFDLSLDSLDDDSLEDLPNEVFDSTTGEAARLPDTVSFVDPLSSLVVNTPATFLAETADDSKLIVMDAASGEEVFSLAGDRVQALSAEPLFLLGRMLYLQTTDAVLVVDCDSGEVTDPDVFAYPVDFAGGIVKLSDGTTEILDSM